MSNSAKNIIIASDFGGTKGDLFIVNADDGSILRHVFKTWRDLPKEILSEIKTTKGGIGRSPQMFCYCLEKAMPGLDFDNYYFVSSGFCFYTTLTEFLGAEPKLKLVMGEANGVMFAEGFKTGICSLLGTGATSDIFVDGQSTFLIDSFGPVCGDWGGADYIGFNFLRNVMREQMFLDEMMPETNAILQFIEENVKDAHPYDHSKPMTPIRANSRIVTVIACHENNVSLVSSFAAVCDSCARNGSAIAQNVLETAGREIAENIYRSAVFKKIDKIDGLPIVVSGSVFMHSDIVFESFRKTLSPKLPNAKIIRSFKPQAYGQVIRMLQEIHTPEKAAECIARFKQDIENLINVKACNSNSNNK